MTSRRKRGIVAAVVMAIALGWWVAPAVTTLAFLLDIGGIETPWRSIIPVGHRPFTSERQLAPTRHGAIEVRVYQPTEAAHTVVVFPGVHGGGVDEPRLARFCSRLAATGVRVVCAPLPELREFLITPRSTDQIEDVTLWAADTVHRGTSHGVALVGVSFAGGLALVAAGRPAIAHRLRLVVSIGGHGDLPRALTYLATGRLPDGTLWPPHDYGLAVLAYDAVERLVPPEQVGPLARGIRIFLEASLDQSPGQPVGAKLLAQARDEAARLPEPARSILVAVTERDRSVLGARLLPLIPMVAGDPALSPERSPPARAPVFLLHGTGDNVIPSSETSLVARYLTSQGNGSVRLLLTPLLSHADLRPMRSARDGWRLLSFWQAVLDAIS